MKKFYIAGIVPETPEPDGGWSVYFPDIPNLSAKGKTVEEAIHNATSSLYVALRDMAKQNTTLPTPTGADEVRAKVKAKRESENLPYPENTEYQFFAAPCMEKELARLNISLPKFLVKEMDMEAEFLGITRSGLIHEAAQEYIVRGREGRKIHICGFMAVQNPCGPDWQNGIYEVIKGLRKKGWVEKSPQIYFYTHSFAESVPVEVVVEKIEHMVYPAYFQDGMIEKHGNFPVEMIVLMNSRPVLEENIVYQYSPTMPPSFILEGGTGLRINRSLIQEILSHSPKFP